MAKKRFLGMLVMVLALVLAGCPTDNSGGGDTGSKNKDTPIPTPTYGVELSGPGEPPLTAYTFSWDSRVSGITVMVRNTGNQPTGALSIALSGPDAALYSLKKTSITSIPEGGAGYFEVWCTGGATATTATVTVSGPNNISASFTVSYIPVPFYDVELSGMGEDRLTFYTFPPGNEASSITVTVRNTGNQPTGDLSIGLSGEGAALYSLTKTSITSIPEGKVDSFEVRCNRGTTAATAFATVIVSGHNIDASFTVVYELTIQ